MNTHGNNLHLERSYSTFGECNLGEELRISHGDSAVLIISLSNHMRPTEHYYAGKSGRGGITGLGTEATLF